MKVQPRLERALGAVILGATFLWFSLSRLAFAPVPWPDGSAFYLPSLELLAWPPHWAMSPQAAFEPSYAQANFNIMPGHTVFLGLGTKLGLGALLGSAHAIKALSLVPLALWAWALWRWLRREGVAPWIAAAVFLAALWDPTPRWGQLAVRTEAWMGFFWVLMLRELLALDRDPRREKRRLWRVAGYLSAAAFFHYEAVYLVPATAVGLFARNPRDWLRRLLGISWRVVLLLSPWLVYLALHFPLFVEQMALQFNRLSHGNHHFSKPYLLFHSLFLWLGSPEGTPKFFNVGKGIFWGLVVALTLRAGYLSRRPQGHLRLAAALAFWTNLYLWWSKPEAWFTTLGHVTLWAWVGLELALLGRRQNRTRGFLAWASAAFAALALTATIGQAIRIPAHYDWATYRAWVDCIEGQAELARKPGETVSVWQPAIPDVLVELSDRRPGGYRFTRSLDLQFRRAVAEEHGRQVDVLVMTRFFDVPLGSPPYSGPERESDRMQMSSEVELPFGPWALEALASRPRHVCQFGPFWASVFVRR
jgi:hypothetical protein